MASLFGKYPQLGTLKERRLFLNGGLAGHYGIRWTDDLDIEAETVYEEGKIRHAHSPGLVLWHQDPL